jgi:hypothetical protein
MLEFNNVNLHSGFGTSKLQIVRVKTIEKL